MNILLALILVLLFFILLILLTPVKYSLEAGYQEELSYSIDVKSGLLFKFGFKRLGKPHEMHFKICGISLPERSKKLQSQENKSAHKQNSSFKGIETMQSFLINRLQVSIWRLLKQVLTACRPDKVIITGRYGFYEPYLTAWVLPCLSLLDGLSKSYRIDFNPVWDQEYLEVYLLVNGSIIPALLIWYLLTFVLQASTLRFLRMVNKNRKTVQPC